MCGVEYYFPFLSPLSLKNTSKLGALEFRDIPKILLEKVTEFDQKSLDRTKKNICIIFGDYRRNRIG